MAPVVVPDTYFISNPLPGEQASLYVMRIFGEVAPLFAFLRDTPFPPALQRKREAVLQFEIALGVCILNVHVSEETKREAPRVALVSLVNRMSLEISKLLLRFRQVTGARSETNEPHFDSIIAMPEPTGRVSAQELNLTPDLTPFDGETAGAYMLRVSSTCTMPLIRFAVEHGEVEAEMSMQFSSRMQRGGHDLSAPATARTVAVMQDLVDFLVQKVRAHLD